MSQFHNTYNSIKLIQGWPRGAEALDYLLWLALMDLISKYE